MKNNKLSVAIITPSKIASGVVSLSGAALKLGYDVSISVIGEDDVVGAISRANHVIYRLGPRSRAAYVKLLEELDETAQVELSAILNSFDKIKTYALLSDISIPMPKSWVVKRDYIYHDTPFVLKIPNGNQGRGVELISNQSDLRIFFDTYKNVDEFLAQEFIAEAQSRDKRLIVVGNKVVAAMQRQSTTDDFRANLHLGARAKIYTPTSEETLLAVRSIKAFGLRYGGVDIIDSIRGPLVLEINPSPGFAISDITGVDVAYEVIKGIMGAK